MSKADWIVHPYTSLLIEKLHGDVEEFSTMWADGAFTSETVDGTIQLNALNIGKVQATKDILDWIKEEERHEETEDHGVSGTD